MEEIASTNCVVVKARTLYYSPWLKHVAFRHTHVKCHGQAHVACSAWAELFNTHAHIYYSSAITIDYLLPLCDNTVSRYQVAIRGVNLQNCYPRSQVTIRGVNLQIAIRDHKSLSAALVYKSLSTITSRYPRCQSASHYPRCQSASRYPRSNLLRTSG